MTTITHGAVAVDQVLQGAIEEDLVEVLILGRDGDGKLYAATSAPTDGENTTVEDLIAEFQGTEYADAE